jgi:hypothetical protein
MQSGTFIICYVECRFAECHYAKCRGAVCQWQAFLVLPNSYLYHNTCGAPHGAPLLALLIKLRLDWKFHYVTNVLAYCAVAMEKSPYTLTTSVSNVKH